MKRMIRHVFAGLFLLGFMATPVPNMVQDAAAQYTPNAGFELAWSLDPRSDTDLFPRGPAFGARSVYVGMDFDNDGKKEILFTTDETLAPGGPDPGFMEIFLYENDGDNNYVHVWHYTHPEGSNSLPAVTWGDIDGDGLQEIYFGFPTLASATDVNKLFVFEQNEALVFPDTPTTKWDYGKDPSADFRPSGFAFDDVDDDGDIELITTSRTSGARALNVASVDNISAFSTWTTEFEAGNAILGGGSIYDVDVVDFDNDGHKEIWVNTWDLFSLAIFEAVEKDSFALQVDINQYVPVDDPGSHNVHGLLFADIDSDDRVELMYPLTDGIYYFLDDVDDVSTLGGPSFDRVGKFGSQSRGAAIGDLDADGLMDIIVNTGTDETIHRIAFQGGDPADSTNYEWTTILDSSGDANVDRWYPLQIADDLDGDGYPEIVVSNIYASAEGQPIIIVLEYTGGSTAVEPIDTSIPQDYALMQNYPNPFSSETTIEYAVAKAGQATVTVYNIMGQVVRTLVDDVHQPGTYRTSWDGTNDSGQRVSSGSYIYSIEVAGGRTSRSLALTR